MTDDDDKGGDARRSNDAGLYVYSRFASAVLGLVTIGVATRSYGEHEFAFVATVLLLYETAFALGSLGLPDAVFYFVGRESGRAPIVVRQASYLLALVAIPVIAIVITTGFALSKPEVDLVPGLPWIALALLFAIPTQPAINQLLAIQRARAASLLQTGYAFLNALAIMMPIAFGWDATWTPKLLAGATSVRLIVHLVLIRTVFPLPRGVRWRVSRELRDIMGFAAPAGLATLCGKLNPQIDKYVVNIMLSTQVFAFYTAAAWELPLISMIPYAIGAVMQVRYVELHANRRLSELHELWCASASKAALIVFPVTIFVIAGAPEIVELLFGPAYRLATLPFQLFTAVLLHRVASYGAMLQATNQTRALLVSSILLIGTNAVLTLPMTWLFGYPGAALATLLANIPPWLWTLSRIADAMDVPISRVMPWSRLARILVPTTLLGVVMWFGVSVLPWSAGPRLVIAAVAFVAAYIGTGRATGILTREDLAFVTRWLSFRLR